MTLVKICGLRRQEDIEYANELLPDYIGLVFYQASKRYIDRERAREILASLDPRIKTVGVFVNMDLDDLLEIRDYCGLDVIQLHGSEDMDYISQLDGEVWKAFKFRTREDLDLIDDYRVDKFLLDSYSRGEFGGSGRAFNWEFLRGYPGERMVLAGGLNPSNVKEAIASVNPRVVDLSSGVEKDGFKDYGLMKDLINKVRGD